jgi:hypothetical protein
MKKELAKILMESGVSQRMAVAASGMPSKQQARPAVRIQEQDDEEGLKITDDDRSEIMRLMLTYLAKQNPGIYEDPTLAMKYGVEAIRDLYKNKALLKRVARKVSTRGSGASMRMAKKSLVSRP